MKAVILAGGAGARLKPFTYVMPKPMLPYKQKPMMEHVIRLLKRNGITDIIVMIGYLGYQIRNYFQDGSKFGVKIRYVEEANPLGTAGCLRQIRDELNGTFILIGGDNVTDLDLKGFIDFHKRKEGIATIALFEFEEKSLWGIYKLGKDLSVNEFLEKPSFRHLAGSMIFCLEPKIFEHIPKGKANITDHVIPILLKRGEKLFGFIFKEPWVDIGNIGDYEKMNSG